MTARRDATTAELRDSLMDAMQRLAEGPDAGFAALVRHQLRASAVDASAYGPAVFCLGLGRLITGQEEQTLPAAAALGMLEEMARVFAGLDAEPAEDSLVSLWGMPRTLNSGDGFYALGQQALLRDEALSPEVRLRALGLYSETARVFSEALHAAAGEGAERVTRAGLSLYAPATALAALCCRLDDASFARLAAIARDLETRPEATVAGALQKAASLNLLRP